MAELFLNNALRIASLSLNYVSPSVIADIILHPFDFATVLLQLGYDPIGARNGTTTLVSVILQYAFFSLYIPYLLTSVQGIQYMGVPNPSIFYYVKYIYSRDGVAGCYRGLLPKVCERLVMVHTEDAVKQMVTNKGWPDSQQAPTMRATQEQAEEDQFVKSLINGICSHFFAVLASHPFHVVMVNSFAEFTNKKKSSLADLTHNIYSSDGYFGFFVGLAPRLVGELLALVFSVVYTSVLNKQRRQRLENDLPPPPALQIQVPHRMELKEASKENAEHEELQQQLLQHHQEFRTKDDIIVVHHIADLTSYNAFRPPTNQLGEKTIGGTPDIVPSELKPERKESRLLIPESKTDTGTWPEIDSPASDDLTKKKEKTDEALRELVKKESLGEELKTTSFRKVPPFSESTLRSSVFSRKESKESRDLKASKADLVTSEIIRDIAITESTAEAFKVLHRKESKPDSRSLPHIRRESRISIPRRESRVVISRIESKATGLGKRESIAATSATIAIPDVPTSNRSSIGSADYTQIISFFGRTRYSNVEPISDIVTHVDEPFFMRNPTVRKVLNYVPLNSKYFYFMMVRDYISKKISYPFFLVCHCMIVLDTGWEKLPLMAYVEPLVKFVHIFIPRRKHDD